MGEQEQGGTSTLPLKLFLLGFLLVFVGVIVLVVAALLGGDSSVSGAAVIIVWFIPIVVGAGPNAFFAILLAAILAVLAFVVFVWMRKQASKA